MQCSNQDIYGGTPYSFLQKPKHSLCSDLLILINIMFSPVGTSHLLSGWSISDASEIRYGGYVVEHGGCMSHGWWSAEETKCSSTWRELFVAWLVSTGSAHQTSKCKGALVYKQPKGCLQLVGW